MFKQDFFGPNNLFGPNQFDQLNGLNMLNKQGIKDYVDSMEDTEHLYENGTKSNHTLCGRVAIKGPRCS